MQTTLEAKGTEVGRWGGPRVSGQGPWMEGVVLLGVRSLEEQAL